MTSPAVTIQLYPHYVLGGEELRGAVLAGISRHQEDITYKDAVFHVVYDAESGASREVYVTSNDIGAALPNAFGEGEAMLNFVVLESEIPAKYVATPGWYVGDNFGCPGAACMFDPLGKFYGDVVKPSFYANGDNYNSVISLYRKVLAGGLTPGYNGDPTDGSIYR